jgi:hypothetical protein
MRGVAPFRGSRLHLAILQAASLLVPGERRAEWLAEWQSELWYASRECDGEASGLVLDRGRLSAFCLGSFKDALWLRRNAPRPAGPAKRWLDSPRQCIGFLAALAALSAVIAFLAWVGTQASASSVDIQESFAAFKFILIFGCSILPAFTSLSLGELPGQGKVIAWTESVRRLVFLAAKVLLILLVLYCGSLILACNGVTFVPSILQIMGLLWGCTFALRWALNDQRHRCPVCLRLLAQPVWVGDRSRYFLEWNCIELVCPRAHGLMYVPERPASWFSTQRWLCLDSSWRGLPPAYSTLNHLS